MGGSLGRGRGAGAGGLEGVMVDVGIGDLSAHFLW